MFVVVFEIEHNDSLGECAVVLSFLLGFVEKPDQLPQHVCDQFLFLLDNDPIGFLAGFLFLLEDILKLFFIL